MMNAIRAMEAARPFSVLDLAILSSLFVRGIY